MFRLLGLLFLLSALGMMSCGLYAYWDKHPGHDSAQEALFIAALVSSLVGACLFAQGYFLPQRKLSKKQAALVVGIGWLGSGFFGCLPYVWCEPGLSIGSAYFEALSGYTTTGSSTLTRIEDWPRAILLWRSMTNWLGGIGILVLFVAILSFLGIGSKSVFFNESSLRAGNEGVSKLHDLALILVKIYLVFSVACAVGLRLLGLGWFEAICHSMATVSTGGFSTHTESIGFYSDWESGWMIEAWIILFMILSSLNFVIYMAIIRRRPNRVFKEESSRIYLGILLSATCFCALLLWAGGKDFAGALRHSAFMVVSISTTTGFATTDYQAWQLPGQLVLLLLMIAGGCAGSTSGGMKIGRILISLRYCMFEIVRTFRPHLVFQASLDGKRLESSMVIRVLSFCMLYFGVGLAAILVLSLLEVGGTVGDIETVSSAVLATLSNIGPGFGSIGPDENFNHFTDASKVFLAVLMVMGRLEFFSVLLLFHPATWRRY